MIEIVYKEEKQEANGNESYFHLPKNIRQIGDSRGSQKIYVEDYVYTYLRRMTQNTAEGRVAILLGQYNWAEGISYLFIRSALEIHTMEPAPDNLRFDDQAWSEVHDTMERYFKGQSILGWALSLPGYQEELNEIMIKTHLNHFGGNDKTLLRIDPVEKEEHFFIYEGNTLKKIGGFYVYYEKNEPMQNYMIDQNENRSIENSETVADRAVSDFRKIVEEKQEEKEKEGKKPFTYAVAACAAAALVFAAVQKYTDLLPLEQKNPAVTSGKTAGREELVATAGSKVQAEGRSEEESAAITGSEPSLGEAGTAESGKGTAAETLKASDSAEQTDAKEGESAENGTGQNAESDNAQENAAGEASVEQPVENATGQTSGAAQETAAQVWQEYTVQKGDSLSRISERYYGTMTRIKDICALNGIASEDLIYAGQKILLPK